MQTRQEVFEAKPFHDHWAFILANYEQLKAPLEWTSNEAQNLFRLKKAIAHVEALIGAADIDLIPISVWDNFNSPCSTMKSQMVAFLSTPNISHINNCNSHIDSLIQYLSPYVLTGKGAAQSVGKALSAQSKSIDEYTAELKGTLSDTISDAESEYEDLEKISTSASSIKDRLEVFEKEVLSDDETSESIKTKAVRLMAEFERYQESISDFHLKLFGDEDDERDTISSEVFSNQLKIKETAEKIETELADTETELGNLRELYDKVFGKLNDDGGRDGGLKDKYDSELSRLKKYDASQRDIHLALISEIKGLLPDATSAGLASAFAERRSNYVSPIKNFERLYYFSIVVVFGLGIWAITSWQKDTGIVGLLTSTFARTPIAIPVVWLAVFASKRRSEYRRLEEEYAHKETIARSFFAFSKQVENLAPKDAQVLSAKLLDAAIASVSFNASQTLDKNHEDKMPSIENQLSSLQKTANSIKGIAGLFK